MQSQIMEQLESLKAETLKQTMALEAKENKMKATRTERDNARHRESEVDQKMVASTGRVQRKAPREAQPARRACRKLHTSSCELVKGDPHRPIKLNVSVPCLSMI